MVVDIEHLAHRAAVARMVVALTRHAHIALFPRTMPIAEAMPMRLMLNYMLLWHHEGRPVTAAKLATALGVSRQTTHRRLRDLQDLGYVTRNGREFCLTERMNVTHAVLRRIVAVVQETAKELSKLDRSP